VVFFIGNECFSSELGMASIFNSVTFKFFILVRMLRLIRQNLGTCFASCFRITDMISYYETLCIIYLSCCTWLRACRMGETVDRSLLKHLLRMFSALGIYSESFERQFLDCTADFYAAEGTRFMQQTDVPDYLKHVEVSE